MKRNVLPDTNAENLFGLNFVFPFESYLVMKRSIFLLLFFFPVAAFSQPASPGIPANTEISKGVIFEGEPYLAINPTNPQKMMAAWMSFKYLSSNPVTIETRFTTDGGMSWSDTLSLPHQNAAWQSADVSMAWRADGVLFISYIDYLDSSSTDGGDFVVRSTDGGRSFSQRVQTVDAAEDTDVSLDRPWIVVDNSVSNGNLYICTKPAPWNPLPNHTYFTRSTDGGMTWSHELVLDSSNFPATYVDAPMGAPTVAGDGTLSIAYPFAVTAQDAGFALARSHDGGESFSRSFLMLPVEDLKEKDSIKGGFHLIADPANPNHLVFAWPDARDGDYDVFAIASFDGGNTWPDTARVNDDPVGNGVVQDMVWPVFGSDGTLGIVWRDRRNGSSPGYASASDTYFASSMDGGKTWSKNMRLSDSTAPYNPALFKPGNDFLTGAIWNDSLFAAWSEVRDGRVIVNFARSPMNASDVVVQTGNANTNTALTIVPNPAGGNAVVSFALPSTMNCRMMLYDSRGVSLRQMVSGVLSQGIHSINCPISGLANGDYFIQLTTETGVSRAKLTINR